MPFSSGDIRTFARIYAGLCCQKKWFNTRCHRQIFYAVDPKLLNTHTSSTPKADTLFHRLRLGVVFARLFLHKIGGLDMCGHTTEDVPYILLECPNYDHYRAIFRTQLAILDSRRFTFENTLGLCHNISFYSRAP